MIVAVIPGRRDGKSSFKKLSAYISEGIYQSNESPLKTSWDYLTQYITKESVLNALDDKVEKTIAVEVGNLESLKTAPHEMRAVAARNIRQKDPVYHYILSWPEKERPATQDMFGAARHTLKALGMADHQYIVAIHADTDNLHAHIEVNRVHPKTYKAARLEWAHATLHKAARECELMYGWSHDKGIYEVLDVNGKKHIVRMDTDIARSRGAANRYETWSGEQSLESWCKGSPAEDLKIALAKAKTASWQDVHRVLARYGLELKDSGGGGMKIFDVSDDCQNKSTKILVVSASRAFPFMKRKNLEQRFGPFESKAENLESDVPHKTYKRDPHKRLDRRLARKAQRDALYTRYKQDMAELRTHREIATQEAKVAFGEDDRKKLIDIDVQYRKMRSEIRLNTSLSAVQKQQAYMLAKITMSQKREQLKSSIKSERAAQRALLPAIPTWRDWVEQQAQLGDEAAISALRGLVYQDKRDRKKLEIAVEDEKENAILPASLEDTDPYIRAIQNIVWKVAKNGRVLYTFKNGAAGFVDEGKKLTFGRKDVTDEALMVTLHYAAEKWGKELKLTGGDADFKARVTRMAVGIGIQIKNPELQTIQRQYLAELEKATSAISPKPLPSFGKEGANIIPATVKSRRKQSAMER